MVINVLEFLEDTLGNFPDRIAVIDGDRRMSFRDLERHAKVLSHVIINKTNGGIKSPVGVFLPKSFESVFADIAILYSGNIYMNLDIKTPLSRIKKILDTAEPKLIFSLSKYETALRSEGVDVEIINVDEIDFSLEYDNKKLLEQREKLIDTDPMCIINTSGSTGTPKGVTLNHRNFVDYTDWATESFDFFNEEIMGSMSPIVFDHHSYEICLMMKKATTMLIIPEKTIAFPMEILDLLKKEAVTYIFWVPTIMVNIANMDLLTKVSLDKLKLVWFAGEVFPTKQFNYWRKNLPNATFANLYGPTEITVDCTYFIVDRELRDDEPIPIGYPCRNTDILVLNDENKQAAISEDGELCVRGSSLAMGYYNNPEKTSAAFVQNPLNNSYPEIIYRTGDIVYKNERGEIIFKGRKDSLIKHLGYRIELGEIEHVVVNSLKMANNCCCVYDRDEKRITLFYESKEDISDAEFRKRIGTQLPKYMIPTVYIRLDEMPRNTNGKIDRLSLKKI